ncbi:Serine/arginine-rich splicing factor rs41 [Orobanche minor]
MRPIFCGNLEFGARQSDLERLFRRYGRIDRVDMKSEDYLDIYDLPRWMVLCLYFLVCAQDTLAGFAFIYMEDDRDAEDAVRKLDRIEFGRKGRRLRVEWTKQERVGGRRPDNSRKSSANSKPSKTLFVINFDPIDTRTGDIERHFEQYGKITNVRIRKNFAFVQFEMQEDATRALEATHMSKIMDKVISVEYAVRDDDENRNMHSPDRRRGRDVSPDRMRGRGRSPSPYRRDRGSPDYGHGAVPNARSDRRDSRDYDKPESPTNERYHRRPFTSAT